MATSLIDFPRVRVLWPALMLPAAPSPAVHSTCLFAALPELASLRPARCPRRIQARQSASFATCRRALVLTGVAERRRGANDYRCWAGKHFRRQPCGQNGRIVRVSRTSAHLRFATSDRTASEQRPAQRRRRIPSRTMTPRSVSCCCGAVMSRRAGMPSPKVVLPICSLFCTGMSAKLARHPGVNGVYPAGYPIYPVPYTLCQGTSQP